jgi:hypothetical protein
MLRLRSKFVFLAGFGLGYYLGTGAGQERRRQIDDLLHRVEDNPTVNKLARTIRRNADEVAGVVSDRMAQGVDAAGDRVSEAADHAGDALAGSISGDRSA